MRNICVWTWIGWYVLQPMHDICVIIYVRMCHRPNCAWPRIELSLVTSVLTPTVVTSKTDGNVNKIYLHVKKVYHTNRTLNRCQDRDKYELTPLKINSIAGNIPGLHKSISLKIKSIRRNIEGLCPYPNIGKSNRKKSYWLYLKIVELNNETQFVYNQPVRLHKVQREVR